MQDIKQLPVARKRVFSQARVKNQAHILYQGRFCVNGNKFYAYLFPIVNIVLLNEVLDAHIKLLIKTRVSKGQVPVLVGFPVMLPYQKGLKNLMVTLSASIVLRGTI